MTNNNVDVYGVVFMILILLKILNKLSVGILADVVDNIVSVLLSCVNFNATINVNGGVVIGE